MRIRMMKTNKIQIEAIESFTVERDGAYFQVEKGKKFSIILAIDQIILDSAKEIRFLVTQIENSGDAFFAAITNDKNDNNANNFNNNHRNNNQM